MNTVNLKHTASHHSHASHAIRRRSENRATVLIGVIAAAALGLSPRPAVAADNAVLDRFQTSFQFTYTFLDWKDGVRLSEDRLLLKDLKSGGGMGVVRPRQLTEFADRVPVLRLRTAAGNTARILQLKIQDIDGRAGVWQYKLPAASADWVTVIPNGGRSLKRPNLSEDPNNPGKPRPVDLDHVAQYQLLGDWQDGRYDLEVASIELSAENTAILAARDEERQQNEAAEATKRDAVAKGQAQQADDRQRRIRVYQTPSSKSPEVKHVSLVSPDILALTIEAQWIVPASISKYVPQSGDQIREVKRPDGTVKFAVLNRKGEDIGRLQGRKLDWFYTEERIDGDPLLDFLAEDASLYTVTSENDSAFSAATKPLAVYRKTFPTNTCLPNSANPTRHQIYLKFSKPFQDGQRYRILVASLNLKNRELDFQANLAFVRSESVHVNQIGYRPDDPVKRAFLSVWLGTGGPHDFAGGLKFRVIDDATRSSVFMGNVTRVMAADGNEAMWTALPRQNFSKTGVYRMDFSKFGTPGRYRIVVDGIGCSYPFTIGDGVWKDAFLTQMKGLYNQRSGVELGPPYTAFNRPRDFHADDGAVITRSKFDLLTPGGATAYAEMAKGDTGQRVENAWGGYHDAGDWNPRRVTHLYTALAQLELLELFPDYFRKVKLSIPPSPGVPDVVTEALFGIDCFRRLQNDDGSVPAALETEGDPLHGEISWLSTQRLFVLAPNIRDCWLYAATAARAAKVLKPLQPELATIYLDSATRAFDWAEREYARRRAAGEAFDRATFWDAFDARNLAALILYDISGKKTYHDVFLENSELKRPNGELASYGHAMQSDAAFLYTRVADVKADPLILKHARAGVIALADRSLKYAAGNAFNITQREPGRPMFAGHFSTSGGAELVRAHYLTGKPEYLAGAVQSCQFQAGCNPNNLVYTTGLGANPIKVPLELDARSTGQPAPVGLTVFGNSDFFNFRNSFWDLNLNLINKSESLWPNAYEWPITEAYWDAWVLVSANEYVIETWWPNVLVWGYLAARPEIGSPPTTRDDGR